MWPSFSTILPPPLLFTHSSARAGQTFVVICREYVPVKFTFSCSSFALLYDICIFFKLVVCFRRAREGILFRISLFDNKATRCQNDMVWLNMYRPRACKNVIWMDVYWKNDSVQLSYSSSRQRHEQLHHIRCRQKTSTSVLLDNM